MKKQGLYANTMLLVAAAIWGSTFVSQRIAARYIGAFFYNGARFIIGGLALLPLLLILEKKKKAPAEQPGGWRRVAVGGLVAGFVLFIGSALQQMGMSYTTAGKAGFITDLYIVLVPVIGIFLGRKPDGALICGVAATLAGLFLLSVNDRFGLSKGDLFELASAFFWSFHILLIDYFSKKIDPIKLVVIQNFVCGLFSIAAGLFSEKTTAAAVISAAIPVLYAGVLSVGVAYTLQALAQRRSKASYAALIMSLESVFAAISGAVVLGERMTSRGYVGAALMVLGMVITQLPEFLKERTNQNCKNTTI